MVWRMSVEEALKIIMEKLEERGLKPREKRDDQGYRVEVDIDGRKAHIRLIEEEKRLVELHLHYENVPGVTIVKCEKYQRVAQCVDELLRAVGAHTKR